MRFANSALWPVGVHLDLSESGQVEAEGYLSSDLLGGWGLDLDSWS